MDIISKIDEALKKPSFDEWLNNKKNYRKIKKEFEKNYSEYANEYGQDILDRREEDDVFDEDPIAAYEDDAHNQGYQAEYDAANNTIYNFKREFDYKRGDEQDSEKQYELADKMGYRPSFR